MKPSSKAVALLVSLALAAPRAAQAHDDTGLVLFDIFLNMIALGVEVAAIEQQAPPPAVERERYQQSTPDDDWPPPRWSRRARPRHDARQGLLMSFGLGGGRLFISPSDTYGRAGAFDLNFRLGYGFSDRFQLFGDASFDAATYPSGQDIASWTLTMRGQTVLIGDREGNGLNINAGLGIGGVSYSYNHSYDSTSSPTGLALVAGLSYDARLGPFFALSPELYVTWHEIPNRAGLSSDVASSVGLRLNFLWYVY